MLKKFTSISNGLLLTLSVLIVVLFTTAGDIREYLVDKSSRDSGQLVEMTFTEESFRKESIRRHRKTESWASTDGDPQLILEQQMAFSGIEFYMEYAVYPGEILLYYTTPTHPEYSNANMAVMSPVKGKSGWFTASIPLTEVTSIRIDPTTLAGNLMNYGDFVVNPQKTLTDFLAPDGYTVLSSTIYSLVLFAILSFIKDFFTKSSK